MIRKASNNKNSSIAFTIALISLLVITSVLSVCFLQPNSKVGTETTINQSPKQSTLATGLTDINKTLDRLVVTSFYYDYSSGPSAKTSISLDNPNSATSKQSKPSQLFYSFDDNTNQRQIAVSDTTADANESDSLDAANSNNNKSSASVITATNLFDTLNFATYTYGGYSVQQSGTNRLSFSFPDGTNQGQIAGSDAITVNTFLVQKIDFDAAFITPKISALGFDEMVVFAASDTTTYKGTEFGIRLDLNDGFIYGYNQEPNGNYEDVNFQMIQLASNDGMIHHYTLIMLGTKVTFYVDGVNYGHLGFPSQTDYSGLTFSILAVVHRFTDDWDSVGDNMTVENFDLTNNN